MARVLRTDLDINTREKAIEALSYFAWKEKSDEAVTAIVEALKVDLLPEALEKAYGALVGKGPLAEAAIISGSRHKDPKHRHAAINALAQYYPEDTAVVDAVINATDDTDANIQRHRGGRALEHIAMATERDFSKNLRPRIRPEGEIGPATKVIVPALCKLLKDTDSNVPRGVMESLDRLGKLAKAAIPDLIDFVEAAFAKIKKIGAERYSKNDFDERMGLSDGVHALGNMGPAAVAASPQPTPIKPESNSCSTQSLS